jgi:hypothetical protein
MVIKFVRDQYPQARFKRIYDATVDGWKAKDFHRRCDKRGWTLTIVETSKDFIFGGFTTAEWETHWYWYDRVFKTDPQSFLFSVNEGIKYPITHRDRHAISCWPYYCAMFGEKGLEFYIVSESNNNSDSHCYSEMCSFDLPDKAMNGG